MAEKIQQLREKIVSPIGASHFTSIHEAKPNKLDPNNKMEFHAAIVLSPEEAEQFKENCESFYERGMLHLKEQGAKIRKVNPVDFKEELDKEGEPTGNVIIRAKLNATWKNREGEEVTNLVAALDRYGKPFDEVPAIGNGSKIRIGIELSTYLHPATGFGISYRLGVVKVLDLVPYGDNTGEYAFDDDETEAGGVEGYDNGADY